MSSSRGTWITRSLLCDCLKLIFLFVVKKFINILSILTRNFTWYLWSKSENRPLRPRCILAKLCHFLDHLLLLIFFWLLINHILLNQEFRNARIESALKVLNSISHSLKFDVKRITLIIIWFNIFIIYGWKNTFEYYFLSEILFEIISLFFLTILLHMFLITFNDLFQINHVLKRFIHGVNIFRKISYFWSKSFDCYALFDTSVVNCINLLSELTYLSIK